MMSLPGASWTVVTALLPWDDENPRAADALGTAAGAAAIACPDGKASLAALPSAAELEALPAEHPARNSAPPSMAATATSPAAPNRVRRVHADRPCQPCAFSMPM
jgi:hypothetical protein